MMKKLILSVFILLLIGCAPPALVKKEAESNLIGACLEKFSCGMPGCYNYGNPGDKPITAFAMAFSKDKQNQVCASTQPQDIFKIKDCMWGCDYTPKEVQDLALQLCDAHKLTTNIPIKDWNKCEIYAIGWNIVYKKNIDTEVKKAQGDCITWEDGSSTKNGYPVASCEGNNIKSESVNPAPAIKKPKVSIEDAKAQCTDIGFKAGTENFGSCVLELM